VSAGPLRLADGGSGVPEELSELLAAARADGPSAAELEQIAAGIAPLLGEMPSVQPASATGTSAVFKLVAALAVGAAVGGGAWVAMRPPQGLPESAPAATPAPPAEVSQATESAEPAEEVAEAVEPAPPPRLPTANAPSEAALLRQAQSALRSDPARALALAREHQRRFPRGTLAQEREVIAIDALSRLGRSGEAGKRAKEFETQYPGSAHGKKVESSVGSSPR
jgi:hypothetical protein